jgi:hypothetical protein
MEFNYYNFFEACEEGRYEDAKLYLSKGYNPKYKNESGATLLFDLDIIPIEIINILLETRTEVSLHFRVGLKGHRAFQNGKDINHTDDDGFTPLMALVSCNFDDSSLEKIDFLLFRGVNRYNK